MERLSQHTIEHFVEGLASDAPTPGGGGVAALSGALGTALSAMVCSFTVNKPRYAEFDAQAAQSLVVCHTLQRNLLDAMERDAETFGAVAAVFAMPKGTDEEKSARTVAMQSALKGCTQPPYEMMVLSVQALELTRDLVGKSNPNVASDLGCAAVQLRATLEGAWLNVRVNLGSIRDEAFVAEHRSGGEALIARGVPMAEEIYATILGSL